VTSVQRTNRARKGRQMTATQIAETTRHLDVSLRILGVRR
jgi:hypothetical protein